MDGQRVEKKSERKGKKLWIAAGAAAAVVLCAYLGLCAWVGSVNTIFPNVTVLGVDVSGMTVEQAQAAVERALDESGDQVAVTLRYGGGMVSVTAQELREQWGDVAQPAYDVVSQGSFFTQGGRYLAHLLGVSHAVQIPRSPENSALEQMLDRVENELGGDVTSASYQVEDDTLVMTKGRTGLAFDRDELRSTVLEAMDEALELKFTQSQAGVVNVERELSPEETAPQEPDFEAIRQAVATEPVSAQMDPETFEITDHVTGVDFDVQTLKAAYESAEEGETFSIPLTLTEPKDTRESLEAKLFCDVLGEASTNLIGTASRQFNVKLAASAVNGAIILPGEVFSFNELTGSRSAAMGYQTATVYNNGKTVQEVGGGVCQTSSTIYYAFLYTNLEVVERVNHGYRSDYVPDGFDATVYYPVTDFKFRNNTDYPIKVLIYSEWRNGREVMVSKILGTNEEGIYAIPSSTTYDWVYPTTVYQPDETIPRGTTKVDTVQNPYTGVKAHTYRSIYDKDGNLIETQDMGISVYKMRPKTILYLSLIHI